MRITKQQLQQIINEEISDVLMRMKNRRIAENNMSASLPPGFDFDAVLRAELEKATGKKRADIQELLDKRAEEARKPRTSTTTAATTTSEKYPTGGGGDPKYYASLGEARTPRR